MSKELKVKYENFKSKYKVIPSEMELEGEKIKYSRAKKKAKDKEITKDYIGKREDYEL